jgi:hypothetical protein
MDRDAYIERTRRYLDVSGARLADAQEYLAPDAILEFPSGTYRSLVEMAAAAEGRYRWIGKAPVSWDVSEHDGTVTVVNVGTLHGENVHGVEFEGIRYVDRIVYRADRIVLQQVWNDLAESGVLERRPA